MQTLTEILEPRKKAVLKPSKYVLDDEAIVIQEDVVYKTTEYGAFSNFHSNRVKEPHKIKNLIESMKEPSGKYLIAPILVNEDLKIIDGQHRFEAITTLGLPLYFILKRGLTEADIPIYNTNAINWNFENYMDAYATEGFESYIQLKAYIARHEISLNQALRFISGLLYIYNDPSSYNGSSSEFKRNFESGEFEFQTIHDEGEVKVARYKELRKLFEIIDPENYKSYINSDSFIRVTIHMLSHKKYNHTSMIKSFRERKPNGKLDKTFTDFKQYKSRLRDGEVWTFLTKIYNFGKHSATVTFK